MKYKWTVWVTWVILCNMLVKIYLETEIVYINHAVTIISKCQNISQYWWKYHNLADVQRASYSELIKSDTDLRLIAFILNVLNLYKDALQQYSMTFICTLHDSSLIHMCLLIERHIPSGRSACACWEQEELWHTWSPYGTYTTFPAGRKTFGPRWLCQNNGGRRNHGIEWV